VSEPGSPAVTIRRRLWPTLAIGLGVLWWLGWWLQLDHSVLIRVPLLDEAYYLEQGAAVARGHLLPDQPFIMSPLYPYLVALTGSGREVRDAGLGQESSPWGIRLLQLACWAGTVWLLWRAGHHLGLGRYAAAPPLLFALYGPAAIFTTTSLIEMPLTFTTVAYLYSLANLPQSPGGRGKALRAGVLLGVASLLRASSLVLLVPAWVLCGATRTGRRQAMWLTAATLALLLPVTVFNSVKAHRVCGVSCNGGLNLYIGNGPEATGLYVAFTGFDIQNDLAGVDFLGQRLGRPVAGAGEADAIWAAAARDQMIHDPLRVARLWCKKVWLHFVGVEIPQVTPLAHWHQEGSLLRLLPVPYALIASLGLLGLAAGAWRQTGLRVWILALAVLVAGQSLFFVVSRYRLVLVPILCLLAVQGARNLVTWRGRRLLLGLVMVAGVVAAVQPWGLSRLRASWEAFGHCNLAVRWEKLGTADAVATGEKHYRAALAIDPDLVVAYRGLARLLIDQGRGREAEAIMAAGILRSSQAGILQQDLIAHLLSEDRINDAIPRLAAYLAEHPADADMLHNYAVALARSGRAEAALQAARDLMTRVPEDPRGFVDLGILLARSGRTQEAYEVFTAGLARHPDNPELQHNRQALAESPDAP